MKELNVHYLCLTVSIQASVKMITTKMQEFLTNNVFPTSGTEPTNRFQRNVGTNMKNIRVITSKEDRWKYCKLNPTAPPLRGFTAPVVNAQNASACKLAKFLSETPHQQMSFSPFPFNINNTKHQIQDLQEIPIDSNLRFVSFAINNMLTNIPTKPLQQKMTTNRVFCTTANEILNLCDPVLKQNYFHFIDKYQTHVLSMASLHHLSTLK